MSREFGTLLAMTVETFALAGLLASRTKAITERLRPYAYDEGMDVERRRAFAASRGDVQESFFSGHVAAAFAAAMYTSTVLGDLHGWTGLTRTLRYGALGVAATTAAARVLGGQHYPSDVLVAAGVGALVGWGVPYLHRKRDERRLTLAVGPGSVELRWWMGAR